MEVGASVVVVDRVVLVLELAEGSVVVDDGTEVVGAVVVAGAVVVVVDEVDVVAGVGRCGAAAHGVGNAIGRYIDGFGHASRSMLRALFDTVITKFPAASRHGARCAW